MRLGGLLDANVSGELTDQAVAVLREALSNVVRHAQATQVMVDVHMIGRRGAGAGADRTGQRRRLAAGGPAKRPRQPRVRATLLGGYFATATPLAGGTELSWRAPLPD